ncbi:MAG: ABC transporter substrate-binding protein, partial [Bdellovibrionales bacterium]
FKKGDLDFLGLDAEQFEKKTDGPMWGTKLHKIEAKNDAPKGTAFIGFNLRNPKFSDRNVRLALSQLFNIKFMNEKFFYNKYLQATGPWYQQSIFADPNTKGVNFDPKSANAALKKAGWIDSNKDGVIDKMVDGKLLDFRFTIIYGSPFWEKFLTVYKEELKKSGIDLEIKQLEWNAFQKTLNDWNFDAVALAWGGAFDYDPKQIWHSSSITHEGSNFAGYSNPEVDKLIDKVRGEMDVKKRVPAMRKIYSLIAKDCPYIFFYNPQFAYYAYNNRIHMVKPTYKYGIGKDTWWIAP